MGMTFSWLYGPSQPRESPCCGIPVYPVREETHKFWCDGQAYDPRSRWAIPQRYMLGSET